MSVESIDIIFSYEQNIFLYFPSFLPPPLLLFNVCIGLLPFKETAGLPVGKDDLPF